MENLFPEQYENLCRNAKILEKDGHGAKLLALNDGRFVKIFRRKKLISSALWRPYAQRFQENAERLSQLGISTVKVGKLYFCRAINRHLVFYTPVPGTSLRDFLSAQKEDDKTPVMEFFAVFLANLHEKGVFFRSIHFGNVIVSPDGKDLSLIDVADLNFYSGALNMSKRLRNFKHFLRYREDLATLHRCGFSNFLESYTLNSGLSARDAQKIYRLFNRFLQQEKFSTPANNS